MTNAAKYGQTRSKRAHDKELKLQELAGRPRADICELCSTPGKTVFDHCHNKGHFRGWICHRCNRVLGQVYDNTELLQKMIEYLHNNR